MADMDIDEKLRIISRNTQEIITPEELKRLLETKEHPAVYLGTSVTGRPHIGYFVWAIKLTDFLKAGFHVKLLLADIHGALDNTPWGLLEKKYEYYAQVIPAMLEAIGADLSKFEIVKGSSFQTRPEYIFDLWKLSTIVSVHDAHKAASDVVKMGDNPRLAGLIYPLMQAIDEEYLGVDIQYGGVDQRKILVLARESLPKIGYRSRVEVMTPLVPGLAQGGKMSSSVKHSKIDLLDDEKAVVEKMRQAYCVEGEVEGNGVLAFVKYVIMVMKEDAGASFVIERPEKFGGNLVYRSYADLERDYAAKTVHPVDLKNAVAREINTMLTPIRRHMLDKEQLIRESYPES
jgi:tyrosyl-tRNA synthetase